MPGCQKLQMTASPVIAVTECFIAVPTWVTTVGDKELIQILYLCRNVDDVEKYIQMIISGKITK